MFTYLLPLFDVIWLCKQDVLGNVNFALHILSLICTAAENQKCNMSHRLVCIVAILS